MVPQQPEAIACGLPSLPTSTATSSRSKPCSPTSPGAAAPIVFINLGDCVSGPLWPRETMERLEAARLADGARQSRPPRRARPAAGNGAVGQIRPRPADAGAARPAWPPCPSSSRSRPRFSPSMRGPIMTSAILPESIVEGRLVRAPLAAIRKRLGGLDPGLPPRALRPQPSRRAGRAAGRADHLQSRQRRLPRL